MSEVIWLDLLTRWAHVLFGLTWVGLLFYFNFIQGEYLKEASPQAKSDVIAKLAPRALWWFRWAAVYTVLTGLLLLWSVFQAGRLNSYMMIGASLGLLMFANVWLIIWPQQQVVCNLRPGDKAKAAAKALLASRSNTLFAGPMLLGMLGSFHGSAAAALPISSTQPAGLWPLLLLLLALEINAITGRLYVLASVRGAIGASIALSAITFLLLQ